MKNKTIHIDHNCNVNDAIEDYAKQGKTFEVTKTNRTSTIKINGVKYVYSDTIFKPKHFSLMNQVKKEFLANIDKVDATKKISPFDIEYCDFSDSIKNLHEYSGTYYECENVINIDITKAYYYASYKLGYISKKFFEKCMKLPKHFRLVLIGSIATSKRIYSYTKGNLIDVQVKENELLRQAWFSICQYVDQAMIDIKNCIGKDFIFYWVDGIFFKPNQGKNIKICNVILDYYGFNFSMEYCRKIEAINTGKGNELKVWKNNTVKHFSIMNNKVKGYYFD